MNESDAEVVSNVEPKDYFEYLKGKLSELEYETLVKNQEFLKEEILKAEMLGQKNLLHKAAFIWEVLEKEYILHAADIRAYVNRSDVVKFIDNVTPKNSVKIVELEKYPRAIPAECAAKILKAKELNLFDYIVIVYTDFTNEPVNTPAQKQMIARNKDPIAFGMFVNDKIDFQHERMYFITDWEDEFCDLTFEKLVVGIKKLGSKDPVGVIQVNQSDINKIVKESKLEVEEITKARPILTSITKEKPTWTSRIASWFKTPNE